MTPEEYAELAELIEFIFGQRFPRLTWEVARESEDTSVMLVTARIVCPEDGVEILRADHVRETAAFLNYRAANVEDVATHIVHVIARTMLEGGDED